MLNIGSWKLCQSACYFSRLSGWCTAWSYSKKNGKCHLIEAFEHWEPLAGIDSGLKISGDACPSAEPWPKAKKFETDCAKAVIKERGFGYVLKTDEQAVRGVPTAKICQSLCYHHPDLTSWCQLWVYHKSNRICTIKEAFDIKKSKANPLIESGFRLDGCQVDDLPEGMTFTFDKVYNNDKVWG